MRTLAPGIRARTGCTVGAVPRIARGSGVPCTALLARARVWRAWRREKQNSETAPRSHAAAPKRPAPPQTQPSRTLRKRYRETSAVSVGWLSNWTHSVHKTEKIGGRRQHNKAPCFWREGINHRKIQQQTAIWKTVCQGTIKEPPVRRSRR